MDSSIEIEVVVQWDGFFTQRRQRADPTNLSFADTKVSTATK